ncbi:unnamed protein product [Prunus armeniaca]|uniref:ABC1 atypical kinase-like domain-containing protein n=1 Tax=Prunus armeniaca TaxID=36596 RepID=A0A6J5V080_PRUAR|nr:unnamed protein product [Prunus armeniaca]CAB4312710.1 unnamed protein product [Prunus armeniaca]
MSVVGDITFNFAVSFCRGEFGPSSQQQKKSWGEKFVFLKRQLLLLGKLKSLLLVLKTRKLKEAAQADDASDAKSGPFLQEEIMSLKRLKLLTKHAEPVESAPETIPEASPPVKVAETGRGSEWQRKTYGEEGIWMLYTLQNLIERVESFGALSLCTKLSELHIKAPEHSFAYTKKTIERAFGRKLQEIFDNFEEKPVASRSIAQGHGAGQQVKPIVVATKQVEEAFAFWGTPEGDLVHPAECMQQLLEKGIIESMSGWQRKLDPGYNVMQTLLLKAN